MKKLFSAIAFAFSISMLALLEPACYYDNEAELYPGSGSCDTVAVKYSTTVVTILQNNCYTCHKGTGSVSGFPFETHTLLQTYAASGSLVSRTNSTTNPMPPTGLLDECDRQKIEAWVKAGAPNN